MGWGKSRKSPDRRDLSLDGEGKGKKEKKKKKQPPFKGVMVEDARGEVAVVVLYR